MKALMDRFLEVQGAAGVALRPLLEALGALRAVDGHEGVVLALARPDVDEDPARGAELVAALVAEAARVVELALGAALLLLERAPLLVRHVEQRVRHDLAALEVQVPLLVDVALRGLGDLDLARVLVHVDVELLLLGVDGLPLLRGGDLAVAPLQLEPPEHLARRVAETSTSSGFSPSQLR